MKDTGNLALLILLLPLWFVPALVFGQVPPTELQTRDGLLYKTGSDSAYTGAVVDPGRSEGSVTAGRRDGKWVYWHDNGQMASLSVYENGRQLERTGWHPNGKMSSQVAYDKDGKIAGLMQHWDRNGTLREAHEWHAGLEHGYAKLFDQNGALLRSGNFVNGEKHGTETWWYSDGATRWETHYDNGIRTGTWTQMAPNGTTLAQSTWDDGKLISRVDPHKGH